MIESWDDNIFYNQYYAQCAPKHCSYFITSSNNALYVFTTMIGLFGGLFVALKILVPLIVGWVRNKMCVRTETINVTTNDALVEVLRIFHSNKLISKRALLRQVVEAQVKSVVNQFRLSITQTFIRMLDFIRQMVQRKGLVSSISFNWFVLPPYITTTVVAIGSRSYSVNNYSCGTNSMCVSSAAIDTWKVPGFFVGCSPLECLYIYDVSCTNKLKMPNQYSNITIRPLDYTLSSPNVTVQSLVNLLMVYRWEQRNIIYEQYYASCAPSICTYRTGQSNIPNYYNCWCSFFSHSHPLFSSKSQKYASHIF
ncbi:unnamed protein product [Adineta ricciae]|uniref:Uncharacterized protein n=1 Tax=Adineta ricciae TaxID=249248 RepID=A0A814MBU7_ADIRI|nr:unnamed protein product [Adineta ricciae]CAF1487519.1 unnamed protein product [Adineta ricciae]